MNMPQRNKHHKMTADTLHIREYTPSDAEATATLFYGTVHSVNAADYAPEQLHAWAPAIPDLRKWNDSLMRHKAFVAEENGEVTGFGDIDDSGYLDRLYVHREHQRKGVATALCDRLENAVSTGSIRTHASITARPFFEKRGYTILRKQSVERLGILLTNFVMEKKIF